jgi:hypothetical protein
MAKLPAALFKRPDPILKDMPVGTSGFVPLAAMVTDRELECFLVPQFPYQTEKTSRNAILVTRQADGYHVTLFAPSQWEPTLPILKGWLPVFTLTERYDPELDTRRQKT